MNNRELLNRSAAIAAATKHRSNSLDNFDTLKSPLLSSLAPTKEGDDEGCNGNGNSMYKNDSNSNATSKSPPFVFRLADQTSNRINEILRPSSCPTIIRTTDGGEPRRQKQQRRPSFSSAEKYRRAAESLGLRLPSSGPAQTQTRTKSAVMKKRQATNDAQNMMPEKSKKRRKTVTFRPTAALSIIERPSSPECKAMHRSSQEAKEDKDRAIKNARNLRHLAELYSHEDAAMLRALAQCLRFDTCTRGIEHYLSREAYQKRHAAQLRVVDAVLRTQARHRQNAANLSQGDQPTTDAKTNDIALASASLSRNATIDAVNRGAEDEAAARTSTPPSM